MNREPEDRAGPDGGPPPDAFDAIVADWVRAGTVPSWPDAAPGGAPGDPPPAGRQLPDDTQAAPPAGGRPQDGPAVAPDVPTPAGGFEAPPAAGSGRQGTWRARPELPEDDDVFVPPEAPPLPRLGPPALVGIALLVLGLVLVVAPGWVGVPEVYGLPLGLVGLAAGLGWLVLRLWPSPARGDVEDDDDGAVV